MRGARHVCKNFGVLLDKDRPCNASGSFRVVVSKIYRSIRLLATSGTHAHGSLEGVIYPPLEAGESTYKKAIKQIWIDFRMKANLPIMMTLVPNPLVAKLAIPNSDAI